MASEYFELFGDLTDLDEVCKILQTGIQSESNISIYLEDLHPNFRDLFVNKLGVPSDAVILSSNIGKNGRTYVSGPNIGLVESAVGSDQVVVMQLPGWFSPIATVLGNLSSMDQSFKEFSLVIATEPEARVVFPIWNTLTQEQRKKATAPDLLRSKKEFIKPVNFTYISSLDDIPDGYTENLIAGNVIALTDADGVGRGFVKVGSSFMKLEDVPDGVYWVTEVTHSIGHTKEGNKPFDSLNMVLVSSTDESKTYTCNARRPVDGLANADRPKVTAPDDDWFFELTIVKGEITASTSNSKLIRQVFMDAKKKPAAVA